MPKKALPAIQIKWDLEREREKKKWGLEPAGEGQTGRVLLVGVHHTVERGHAALRVRDDRVGELLELVVRQDVFDPPSAQSVTNYMANY